MKNLRINKITIKSGIGKDNTSEDYGEIVLDTNKTVAIVGPTGSGKTALINDIELLAKGDTNTKRYILINDEEVDDVTRLDIKMNPCVLITQNTKCFSDLKVDQFLSIHAKSRGNENFDIVNKCLNMANTFTGEIVESNMNITTLSGGQTRALLIADAILIGDAPVIILDEIENAGIYKSRVIETVKNSDKMVIFVTHDPTIALYTDIRIVMKAGKVDKVIKRSDVDKTIYDILKRIDDTTNQIKEEIREGNVLDGLLDKVNEIIKK